MRVASGWCSVPHVGADALFLMPVMIPHSCKHGQRGFGLVNVLTAWSNMYGCGDCFVLWWNDCVVLGSDCDVCVCVCVRVCVYGV